MAKKYSAKLINDYIDGNDIVGYDIEQLEDDYEFMMQVINYTNDKNMYNLCSKKVRDSYEFTKFIVNKFSDDLEFVCSISDNYLQNEEEYIYKLELYLILCNLTKNKNEEYYMKYKLMVVFMMEEIEICIEKEKMDETLSDKIGMGFVLIDGTYGSSDIIMKHFAERFINKLFFNNENFDFEKMLHQRFDKVDKLQTQGINNYLINFINIYDNSLAIYICNHLELLNEVKDTLNKIIKNWDYFENKGEVNKYEILFEQVHKYMEENQADCYFNEPDILCYIGRELGFEEKIKKYYFKGEEIYDDLDYIVDDFIDEEESNIIIDKNKMNFIEFKHYNNIKKIMVEFLNQKFVDEPEDDYYIKDIEKGEAKVFKMNFNKENDKNSM